jgi:hypothetical protein
MVDTDRTAGNGGTDTVTVYEMHVTSAGPLGNQQPEVAITEPASGTMIETGTEVVFSATVTDEDTNLAAALSWDSDVQGYLGTSESIAATLAEGSHVVTASVMDSGSQLGSDSVSVTVQVLPPDTTPPVVTVLGDNPASAVVASVYTDAGATALDLVDGNVSAGIAVSGLPVNTSTPGSHTVTYTVSDAAGNIGTASRTVNVVEAGTALSVTGVSPSSITRGSLSGGVSVTITGTGFTGIPTVTFLNGSGPTPSAGNVTLVSDTTLTMTISGKAGPRKPRVWDLVATLPGGANAACAGCLTIAP